MDGEIAPTEVAHLEDVRQRFYSFLWNYAEYERDDSCASPSVSGLQSSTPSSSVTYPYRSQVQTMINGEAAFQETLFVSMQHVRYYDEDLSYAITAEWLKAEPYLRQAVHKLVMQIDPDFLKADEQNDREFYLAWDGIKHLEKLRDLRSSKVGRLLSWTGTVTRTTEVRPELYLGTFKCNRCGAVVRNVEQQFVCTLPLLCPQPTCGNKNDWTLKKEESTFVDWQRAKVQENSEEVPAGSLPRTMDVIIRSEMVEQVRPGDKVAFTGCLVVIPDMAAFTAPGERTLLRSQAGAGGGGVGKGVSGIKETGARELHYKLAFLANNVQPYDQKQAMVNARTEQDTTPEEVEMQFGPKVMGELERMRRMPDIYHRLARSVAPGVYGHEDIKKAVLLMLVGGVSKQTKEGIKLRGDINVAIVGDPSTAKSQMLKYVAKFLPRAIFTSGKSSSAAGLTATVVREADSRENAIEAGALMLADNGICCIDEFDKMDIKDQVAIHEAMEQQTISIAKAGIQATLNARTAILAAANPLGGRYDRSKPLKYNVNLPPAILSRFDLLHVMVDEVNPAVDEAIAYHILASHRGQAPKPAFTMLQLQRYIRYGRSIKPKLSPEARARLVEAFKRLRSNDAVPGSGSVYRITVRQLEALIRLSEALARVHHRAVVTPDDVKEAQRLIKASVHSAGDAEVVMELPEMDDMEPAEIADFLLDQRPADAPADAAPDAAQPEAAAAVEAEASEEGDGADPEEGRRVRRRAEAADDGDAAEAADAGAENENGGNDADRPVQQIRISRQKLAYLQNHVLACLKQAEVGADGQEATEITVSSETFKGLSQHDIIKWHIKEELTKGAIQTNEDISSEVHLMQKVIHLMLNREGTLVEMQVPETRPSESRQEYVIRREKERILIINPNYYME